MTSPDESGYDYAEVDGLIVSRWIRDVPRSIATLREREPGTPDWRHELHLNHQHPTHDFDRRALRIARERGAEMAAALRVQFPDRSFALVYVADQVSFCQVASDLPRGIVSEPASKTAPCWCRHCDGTAPFTARSIPDAEFAFAQFGDCDRCGGEILLGTARKYVLV